LDLLATENAAIMRWNAANPGNGPESYFSGLELRFEDLEFLKVGPRDSGPPLGEDPWVSDIVRLEPSIEEDDPDLRDTRNFDSSDAVRLLFRFSSCRTIEIGSGTVELTAVA
jgi:hypothetical protein